MQIFTFAYLEWFFVISGHNNKMGAQKQIRRYEGEKLKYGVLYNRSTLRTQ